MQKRTLKQKCLAWLLSLAVAMTFIPLTAGVAFADTDYNINLEKANAPSTVVGNEVKVNANFGEPWQVGDELVKAQPYTGESLKPVFTNLSCKMNVGTFTEDSVDAAGNHYFTVDYGGGNWTDPGKYTLKIIANPDAAPVDFNFRGTDYTAKFTGTYTLNCTIYDGAHDLAASTVTFSEGTVNKKTGAIELPYDGKLHQLVPAEVKDAEGTLVDPSYYDVFYPNETTNAYRKVGNFDIVIAAKDGNEGGYGGSITKTLSITDFVSDITVYAQNGKNGAREQKKVFKYAKWSDYALSSPLDWGYNGNVLGTSKNYIPVETLLSEAGLGEIGNFNGKDLIDLWTNTDPEHFFNAPQSIAELQKYKYVVNAETEVLNVFGGEFSIPAFLVLDCDVASFNPRGAVGSVDPNGTPRGNMSPSAVSEISLVSMDINGLKPSVANATYTGKKLTPKVTVKDGDEVVPVDITYSNNTNAGTGTATIKAKADSEYYGTVTKKFTIAKAANPMTVKAKKAPTVKAKAVKKAAQKVAVSKVMTISKKQGKLTFKKVSGSKKLTIAKTTGKVTVKKGTKKGTYKIKVKVSDSGSKNYKAGSKTVTISVKVK